MRGKLKPKISLLEPIINQRLGRIINFHYFKILITTGTKYTTKYKLTPIAPFGTFFCYLHSKKISRGGLLNICPHSALARDVHQFCQACGNSRINSNCIWLKDGSIPYGHRAIYLWKRFNEEFQSRRCPTKKAHLWISMFFCCPEHLRGGGGTGALQLSPRVSRVSFLSYTYSQAGKGVRTGCF